MGINLAAANRIAENAAVQSSGGASVFSRRAFAVTAAACVCAPLARAQAPLPLPPSVASRFGAAIDYSAQHGGSGLLIARSGIVLAEDYPGARANMRWPLGAGTRMFAPLLAGSLIADRLMVLDEPVAMSIGEWGADPDKSRITIRQLLNGTSGVAFGGVRGNAAQAIAAPLAARPGARFSDDPAALILFVEIAKRKLTNAGAGSDPAAYFTDRTLAEIGCVPVDWTRDADGAPRFDDGVAVTARGWAQTGELMRRDGVWRAAQLVDETTTREARFGTFPERRVGMGLYLAGGGPQGAPGLSSDLWRMNPPPITDLVMAAGADGQRLYIAPSEGLVIARLARTPAQTSWSDATFLTLALRDLQT